MADIKTSGLPAKSTFNDTDLVPFSTGGTTSEKGTWLQIKDELLGYTSYAATLVQSGTNPPVATILRNNSGLNPVFSYNSNGNYTVTEIGNLTAGKVGVIVNGGYLFEQDVFWGNPQGSDSFDIISSVDGGLTASDGVINGTFLEIIIYS